MANNFERCYGKSKQPKQCTEICDNCYAEKIDVTTLEDLSNGFGWVCYCSETSFCIRDEEVDDDKQS